jgi:PAS domain S-box-containing protein
MSILRIANQSIATEDVFQVIIEHFPDIVHSVNEDGKIVFTNRKAEELLGYSRKELLGMSIRQIYAPEVLQAMERGFKTLKASGDNLVESVLQDRYGNRIPVEIRSFSIYDNEGHFLRTFSILRDIRKVKELQEGLLHSARLAAIGELASGIVHDIDNPLSVIRMCLSLMRNASDTHSGELSPLGAELQESMCDIGRAVQSIEKLVDHLRSFARKSPEKREVFDLKLSVVDALFILKRKLLKNGIEVRDEVEENVHFVSGSRDQIERVLANLISNACDAMAGREERHLTLAASLACEGDRTFTRCDVKDTGVGIARDAQQNIFNSFYTTKEKGKGTGLGLAIVRSIVKEHGGRVDLASEPGRGAIFSVYLPLAPDTVGG